MVVVFDCYSYFYYNCAVINDRVFVYCYVSRILIMFFVYLKIISSHWFV